MLEVFWCMFFSPRLSRLRAQRLRLLSAAPVLATAMMAALSLPSGGLAMSETSKPLTLVCQTTTTKVALPDTLCPQFQSRLEAAYPDLRFTIDAGAETADVVLEVSRFSAQGMEARILWGQEAGPPLGTARAGKALDTAALQKFLDILLRESPRP